jgi:hypothetical protein
MWRQLDRDMSGGAHHNRAPVAGVALEHFQNQKKLLSKHGRKPRSELTNDAAKRSRSLRGVSISVAESQIPSNSHLPKARVQVLLMRANDLGFGAEALELINRV